MKYSAFVEKEDRKKFGRSKGSYLRVHFKNTLETANAIRGLKVEKAITYLENVVEHKQCIPFRRHNGGVGRTAQAKHFKATQGRWPVKSCKFLLGLLKNAVANAAANELVEDDLEVLSVVVNQAPKTRRRTFRAHGRINPYQGHPCHVEVILKPIDRDVPASKDLSTSGSRKSGPKAITAQ